MASMTTCSMNQSTGRTQARTERRRALWALAFAAVSAFAPLRAWADCGVDGTLIHDAAVRGLTAADNLVNNSAANTMNSSSARAMCLEHFGLAQIPPLGIPGVSAIIAALANGAMERACEAALGSATGYLSGATGQLTSAFSGATMPSLSSIGTVNNLTGGTSLSSVVNGATTSLTSAVNGAAGNAGNQILQGVGGGSTTTTTTSGSVWDRMTCWVTGRC